MSKRKKEVDLLAGGAITEEAMEAYLEGALSAEERTQFEKLLADDPFAQDALEGMQAAPNRAEAQTRIAGIKKKIRAQTGGREHKTVKIHWVNYVWAAVVLGMLVGVGFLMVTYLNKQTGTDAPIAQNKQDQGIIEPQKTETTVTTVTEADELTPTLKKEAESSTIVANGYDSAVTSPAPVQQQVSSTQASTVAEANVPAREYRKVGIVADSVVWKDNNGFSLNNYSSTANIGMGNNIPPSAKQRKETAKTKDANQQKAPAYDDANQDRRAEPVKTDVGEANNKLGETVVVTSSKVSAEGRKKIEDTKAASGGKSDVPTQAEAMKNFNAGDYQTSAEQFDAILKSQPNNADAQYFGGVSEYLNGNLSKSEKSFDKLLKGGDRYVDGSKWYKANILIKKGKKEDAKKILNELSNTSNPYKERATNKLKEL